MTGLTRDAGSDVEAIVQAWRSTRPTGTPVPEVIRKQAAAFVDRRGHVPPPPDLGQAIRDVRQRAAGWGAADFVYWSMWMTGSCKWTAHEAGWVARLLDRVADVLPSDCVGLAAFHAWKTAMYPQEFLPLCRWRELFGPGFIDDNTVRQRPAGAITLYRGGSYAHRRNWSWASTWGTAEVYRHWRETDIQKARQADSSVKLERGVIWVARVPWSSVLARSRPANPIDEEWVVDTDGVKVVQFDDSPRPDHLSHCRARARPKARPMGLLGPVSLGSRPDPARCLECGVLLRPRNV